MERKIKRIEIHTPICDNSIVFIQGLWTVSIIFVVLAILLTCFHISYILCYASCIQNFDNSTDLVRQKQIVGKKKKEKKIIKENHFNFTKILFFHYSVGYLILMTGSSVKLDF